MTETEKKQTDATLINYIQSEWADVHHSRVQEWTALGIVAGIHFGLTQTVGPLKEHLEFPIETLIVASATVGVVFSLLGILITFRHRHLMRVKLNWIYKAESKLNLIEEKDGDGGIIPIDDAPTKAYRWKGLAAPRLSSTGGLIVCIYALLIIIDVFVIYATKIGT